MRASLCCLVPLAVLGACSDHGAAPSPQPAVPVALGFETRAEIPIAGASLADGTLADLDGDGELDLVVTTLDLPGAGPTGSVVVLRNERGAFTPGQVMPAPGFACQVAAADLDGDADLDLVVLRSAHAVVAVFANDGNGRFSPRQEVGIKPGGDSLAVTDSDLDGAPDVMLSHWTRSSATSGISVLPGAGNGTFVAPWQTLSLPAGAGVAALTAHDLDGDGLADVIAADPLQGRVLVFRARAAGGHELAHVIGVGRTPIGIAAGDLDQDGVPDLAVSNAGDGTVTILGGAGGFAPVQELVLDGAPGKSAIGDVTGDGIADLVVCTFARAAVSVFPGRSGGLGPELQTSTSGFPFRPMIGDVDGDGAADLLVTGSFTPFVNLYRGGRGTAELPGPANIAPGVDDPAFVAVADLNLDGRAEIAVAGTGGSEIALLALPTGASSLHALAPLRAPIDVGVRVRGVVRGDFDGDNRIDLAVTTSAGVKLLRNVSLPRLRVELLPIPAGRGDMIVSGLGPFEVAAADMDGDGRLDLIVSDATLGRVSIARASGSGYALLGDPVDVPGVPGGLAVADFGGDGAPDVAVARNAVAYVTILENDGHGGLTVAVEEPVGAGPNYLRTADFDLDGRPDLAVSNAATGEVTVLRNGGGYAFLPLSVPSGAVPTGLLAEDVDNDGFPDLVVASLADGDFRVIRGRGAAGFAPPMRFPGTYGATSLDAGNIDGDALGRRDIVIASTLSDRISVYRNAGAPLVR